MQDLLVPDGGPFPAFPLSLVGGPSVLNALHRSGRWKDLVEMTRFTVTISRDNDPDAKGDAIPSCCLFAGSVSSWREFCGGAPKGKVYLPADYETLWPGRASVATIDTRNDGGPVRESADSLPTRRRRSGKAIRTSSRSPTRRGRSFPREACRRRGYRSGVVSRRPRSLAGDASEWALVRSRSGWGEAGEFPRRTIG